MQASATYIIVSPGEKPAEKPSTRPAHIDTSISYHTRRRISITIFYKSNPFPPPKHYTMDNVELKIEN